MNLKYVIDMLVQIYESMPDKENACIELINHENGHSYLFDITQNGKTVVEFDGIEPYYTLNIE